MLTFRALFPSFVDEKVRNWSKHEKPRTRLLPAQRRTHLSKSCLGKESSSCEKTICPSCMSHFLPPESGGIMANPVDRIEVENGQKQGYVLDIQYVR